MGGERSSRRLEDVIMEIRKARKALPKRSEVSEEEYRELSRLARELVRESVLTLLKLGDDTLLSRSIDDLWRDHRTRRFLIVVKYPFTSNPLLARALQAMLVALAAMLLLVSIYLLTPSYIVLSANAGGNTTVMLERVLEFMTRNPEILTVINPLLAVVGIMLAFFSLYSLYLAQSLGEALSEAS